MCCSREEERHHEEAYEQQEHVQDSDVLGNQSEDWWTNQEGCVTEGCNGSNIFG